MKRCLSIGALLYVVLVCATRHKAVAQEARRLTMNEAIELSLQNSKQLKLSQAKINEAAAAVRQARDGQLPDVNATGAYMRMDEPKVDLKLKFASPQGQTSEANPLSGVKIDQVSYGIVSASLPLFAGGKIRYGIASQKYLLEAARLDADNDRESVIQNIINAYCNLYKAQLSVSLIKENLKHAEKRVNDYIVKEQNGEVIHNDVLQVQLQRSNIKLSLLDANNNLDMAILNMDLMLGLPEGTKLLTDSNAFIQVADAGTISDWEQKALANRKDIQSLTLRGKAVNTNIKSIKGDYLPSLALTGNYIAADIPTLLTVTDALGIGIGLKYNFGSFWKTEAKVAQAKAQAQELALSEDMLNDQVSMQINQAYKNYVLSVQHIEVYGESITEAIENNKVMQSRYDNKAATTTDLLNADTALLQAQLNYAYSKADAMMAYSKLLCSAGVLK